MTRRRKKSAKGASGTSNPLAVDKNTSDIPRTIKAALGSNARVCFLPEFIRRHIPSVVLPSSDDDDENPSDNQEELRLFERTIVSVPDSSMKTILTNEITRLQQRESLSSLVDGVVWTLVQRRSRRRWSQQQQQHQTGEIFGRNVLSQGYVLASEGLEQVHAVRPCPNMRPGVLCIHLNDNVCYCQTSKYFQFLHALLGDDGLRMLLLQTTLFLPVFPDDNDDDDANSCPGNDNYLQLCGPPLAITKDSGLSPKRKPNAQPPTAEMIAIPKTSARKKRKRGATQKSATPSDSHLRPDQPHIHPNAMVPRASLFYADAFVPNIGLPSRHILNSNPQPEQLLACMLEDLVRGATSATTTHAVTRIKSKRWWPQLKASGRPICQEMLRLHAKCDYARLLERHCSLPPCCQSKRVYTTPTNTSSGEAMDLSPMVTPLDQVAIAHTPSDHVISFLTAVLRRVFPESFWGSEHNFDVMRHVVDVFVNLRRQERMSNQTLIHGFRVTDITWLIQIDPTTGPKSKKKRKLSKGQHLELGKRVLCLIRWVVGKFVIPLLRSTFYVTEAEFSGRKVLYYRKPVWSLFRSLSMGKLLEKQYQELGPDDALQRLLQHQLSFSRLRLLPKATGVRPLAMLNVPFVSAARLGDTQVMGDAETKETEENLEDEPIPKKTKPNPTSKQRLTTKRKKSETGHSIVSPLSRKRKHAVGPQPEVRSSKDKKRSANDVLRETFDVMRHEVTKNPTLVGSGMFGLNELYSRYRNFMRTVEVWGHQQTMKTQLYFASVDIHKCYDNVQQDHLVGLIREHVSSQDYLIQNYALVFPFESTGRVFKRLKKKVGPPETFFQFHRTAKELSDSHRNCIFIDGTQCSLAKGDATIALLEEHLQSHVVVAKGRYGNRFLLQGNGIPQGSVLSSLLCNLYYGNVEREILGEEFSEEYRTLPPLFLLVRMVDDFMLITTDLGMADRFIKRMYAGSPDRGALINKEKTVTSFNMELRESDGTVLELKDGCVKGINGDVHFPWCGLLFNAVTGEIRVDYSRFAGGKALAALTVDRIGERGRRFALNLKSFVRPRCQSILFDPTINSANVIAINFYQMFLLCAIKAVEFIESSEMNLSANQDFIVRCIDEVISYARGLIASRLRLDSASVGVANPQQTGNSMSQESALWLGRHAFCSVLGRSSGGDIRLMSNLLAAKCKTRKHSFKCKAAAVSAMREMKLSGLGLM